MNKLKWYDIIGILLLPMVLGFLSMVLVSAWFPADELNKWLAFFALAVIIGTLGVWHDSCIQKEERIKDVNTK
jgi:membrane protein DedA with SNARE-associated domain